MMHTNNYFDTGRIRKVWRYQSGNQKPCIEKGPDNSMAKRRTHNDLQNTIQNKY